MTDKPTKRIAIVPRGAPDPGTSWANPKPRLIDVFGECGNQWDARPVDNPACPILAYPKFAWQQVA